MKFVIFFFFLSLCSDIFAGQKTISIKSEHGNWETEVSIFFPKKNLLPRGVVILVPGSESIGEPPINTIFNVKGKINSISKMGRRLIENGFIYVSFNTRGVYPIHKCLNQIAPKKREEIFLQKCWNSQIRSEIDWSIIESDIDVILNNLKKQREFNGLKIILLARSEGGMHISRLIREGRITPDGLVGLGVPSVSPLENSRLQLTLTAYLEEIEKYLTKTNTSCLHRDKLDIIFPTILPVHKANLLKIFERNCLEKKNIQTEIKSANAIFNFNLANLSNLDRTKPVAGAIAHVNIPIMGSIAWWHDALTDDIDLITSLKRYAGNRIFLYGQFDFQVTYNQQSTCPDKPEKYVCEIRIVPNVGHTLEDKNGKMSDSTVMIITKAIQNVLRKN